MNGKRIIGILLGVDILFGFAGMFAHSLVNKVSHQQWVPFALGCIGATAITIFIYFLLLVKWMSPVNRFFSIKQAKGTLSPEVCQEASAALASLPVKVGITASVWGCLRLWVGTLVMVLTTPTSLYTIIQTGILAPVYMATGGFFSQYFPLAIMVSAMCLPVISEEAMRLGIEAKGIRMGFLSKLFLPTFLLGLAAVIYATVLAYSTNMNTARQGMNSEALVLSHLLAEKIEYRKEKPQQELVPIVKEITSDNKEVCFLTDRGGKIIVEPSGGLFIPEAEKFGFNKRLREEIISGREGGIYDYANERYISWVPTAEGRYVIGTILNLSEKLPLRRLLFWCISIFLIASFWIAPLSFYEAKGVSGPCNRLSLILKELTQRGGDLTRRLGIAAYDELGDVTLWLNRFVETLRGMIIQVRTTADKVTTSSQALSSSSQEVNASTAEVSGVITQISKGTTTQAERIEITSKTMEEMANSVKEVAKNAQETASSSDEAFKLATEGGKATQEAAEKITRITEVITDITGVALTLGERSVEIGEITNTITKIADQTNLLALNAAIEAARAGEAGRGFAVVAEEVRKLAEGAATATTKIGSLIRAVQTETQRAISSVEKGSVEVMEGKRIVDRATQSLTEIIKSSQKVANLAAQVTTATQKQLKGTEEVVKSISEVATIAEQSSSAAQEASSSVEEQTASMQEMAASAQELSQMALSLRDLVGKFKLEEEE